MENFRDENRVTDFERQIADRKSRIRQYELMLECVKSQGQRCQIDEPELIRLQKQPLINDLDFLDGAAIEKISLELRIWKTRLAQSQEKLQAEMARPVRPTAIEAAKAATASIIGRFASTASGILRFAFSFTRIAAPAALVAFIIAYFWQAAPDRNISCEAAHRAQIARSGGAVLDDCVTVYFATKRDYVTTHDKRRNDEFDYPIVDRFTNSHETDGLKWGRAEVSVPRREKDINSNIEGKFDFTELARSGANLNRTRVTQISVGSSTSPELKSEYFTQLSNDVGEHGAGKVLFVVHGFNVKFDSALKLAARLSLDLEIAAQKGQNDSAYKEMPRYQFGQPFLFSWPDQEGIFPWDYVRDRDVNSTGAAGDLADALLQVMSQPDVSTINLVVHSMGNRVLLHSLEKLGPRLSGVNHPVKIRIIHASADVSPDDYGKKVTEFETRLHEILDSSQKPNLSHPKVTIYSDANDWALFWSAIANSSDRVGRNPKGQRSKPPYVYQSANDKGLQDYSDAEYVTVDASGFKSDWVNHSAFERTPTILADMACALEDSDKRALTKVSLKDGRTYWKIDAKSGEVLCKLTPVPRREVNCDLYMSHKKHVLSFFFSIIDRGMFPDAEQKCKKPAPTPPQPKPSSLASCEVYRPEQVLFKVGKKSLADPAPAEQKTDVPKLKQFIRDQANRTIQHIHITAYARNEKLAGERLSVIREQVEDAMMLGFDSISTNTVVGPDASQLVRKKTPQLSSAEIGGEVVLEVRPERSEGPCSPRLN